MSLPSHSAIEMTSRADRRQFLKSAGAAAAAFAAPAIAQSASPHIVIVGGGFAGASCALALTQRIEQLCDQADFSRVTNGRFKGGYTTRHYGRPQDGVHALQMELACRGYLREPQAEVDPANWPCPYDPAFAAPMRTVLQQVLTACIGFASQVSR